MGEHSADECITLRLDPQNLPEPLVESSARLMAGLSWIDHRVERYWDQVPQAERDYWKRFARAGILGLIGEAHRQNGIESAGAKP